MISYFRSFRQYLKAYIPKSVICFREGYSITHFLQDLFAGINVGIITVPLALAFAIASGVPPEKGLITAIVGGFLISLLGGSRVQIGGPTGAFIIIVYGIVERHGYEGLAIATIMAGILLAAMGLARFGVLLKFIPYSVTTGFTTGIALVIFTTQVKELLGLQIEQMPAGFTDKWCLYCDHMHTWNPWAFFIGTGALVSIFLFRRMSPMIPGAILAILGAGLAVDFFHLPLATVGSTFGRIPRTLPEFSVPSFSIVRILEMFPDAVTVALLGAIESLLSAVVADGLTGHRHRSNCELFAQGIANIGSVLFGGIPATGAIARTSANIRLGAKTPMAGMIHSVTMLLIMLVLAPLAEKIPLCALSAVLIYVAWNMSELPHFLSILRQSTHEATVLLASFLLTILVDLTVAVQVGVVLSALLFVRQFSGSISVKIYSYLVKENKQEGEQLEEDEDRSWEQELPKEVTIFEIKGPFFYPIADVLREALVQLPAPPRIFILRMRAVPFVDATGMRALQLFASKCQKDGIVFLISGVRRELLDQFRRSGLQDYLGKECFLPNIESALSYAKQLIAPVH